MGTEQLEQEIAARGSGWRLANRILVGAVWLAILILGFVDCRPADATMAEGGAAHYILWLMVGVLVAIGSLPQAWRHEGWAQKLLTICAAITVVDVIAYDIVGSCVLHLSATRSRGGTVYILFSGIAVAQMLAVPAALVALIASFITSGRRRRVSE